MKTLKVWFVDFWKEWDYEDFITPIIKKHYNIVLDEHSPDIVFHSVFNKMQDIKKYNCKKILFSGENYVNITNTDYTITFNPHTDTNYRLPLWQVYMLLNPSLKDRLYNRLNYNLSDFKKWCAFVVSNPSNFIRNSCYYTLSKYKPVNSYGRHLTNNIELQQLSIDKYWRDAKDSFFLKNPHKFMVAYENIPYKYYCTEKLMDSFLVGSMPIYHGDPRVFEDWNEKAFINLNGHNQYNINNMIDYIKHLDQTDYYFNEMYKQPIFTEEQKNKLENNLYNFEHWLIKKMKE